MAMSSRNWGLNWPCWVGSMSGLLSLVSCRMCGRRRCIDYTRSTPADARAGASGNHATSKYESRAVTVVPSD